MESTQILSNIVTVDDIAHFNKKFKRAIKLNDRKPKKRTTYGKRNWRDWD